MRGGLRMHIGGNVVYESGAVEGVVNVIELALAARVRY